MVVPENTGVYINDFMFDLDLKGFELLAYALIYSYSANGNKQGYYGSCETMAKRLHTTRQRINIVLNSLAEKKLVIKHEIFVNKMKLCVYQINYNYEKPQGVIETVTGCHRNSDRGVIETMHNNILNNINNNINSKSHCDETSDTTSSVNDSSSVVSTPSSESLSNEETVSENTECTSSPTTSEDYLSQTSNTFSTSTITQTPKEKESVPAKEKEKVLAKDVIAHYAMRWEQMRGCGRLSSECPKQSFAIIQRLINNSELSLEEIKKVIDLGFKSTEYILIKNKYPLRTMLGSWWVPIALNGPVEEPKRYNNKKYTPASPDQLNANESYEKGAWK